MKYGRKKTAKSKSRKRPRLVAVIRPVVHIVRHVVKVATRSNLALFGFPFQDDGKEEEEKKGDEGQGQREEQGQGQDENDKEGEEGEGPVNDDLEDNYEDKPQGVEVKICCTITR